MIFLFFFLRVSTALEDTLKVLKTRYKIDLSFIHQFLILYWVPPVLKSSSYHKQIKTCQWFIINKDIVCKYRVHVKMTYYQYLSDPDELYVIRDCLKVARLFIGCEKIISKKWFDQWNGFKVLFFLNEIHLCGYIVIVFKTVQCWSNQTEYILIDTSCF